MIYMLEGYLHDWARSKKACPFLAWFYFEPMGQKSLTQKNLSQIEPNQKKPKDILAFPKKAQVQKSL